MILAIDPGTTESAYCSIDDQGRPVHHAKALNSEVLGYLICNASKYDAIVIEMIASYGMRVGAEVFETCTWIGRFEQIIQHESGCYPHRLFRKEVKQHLCHTDKAKDSNIRMALIERFGGIGGRAAAIGTKANPGPLFGVKADVWAALAVALTWQDQHAD